MTTEDFYHTIIPLRDDLLRYAVSLTASSDDADEIMRITGCSAANLRKNLSRARIAIRTQFIHITRQGGNSI